MRRLAMVGAALVAALALGASAWAGTTCYMSTTYWPVGQGGSSQFSSSWWRNLFAKNASFDTTITFIDNVSYGWHATVRSWATLVESHWFSSQVKKGYCRANSSANVWGACSVVN